VTYGWKRERFYREEKEGEEVTDEREFNELKLYNRYEPFNYLVKS
jgi:hypothetical protein